MENEKKITAAAIAQRFLLMHLFMDKFYRDDEARKLMPSALLTITKQDAETASASDYRAGELLGLVHADIERFFSDVETRLLEIEHPTR